ncbi:unnamed protein product, partial [Mesorhabditis spiculigera]
MEALSADIHRTPNCHTQVYKQRVKMQGCLPKVVVGRFCHGTCTSFYIPRLRAHRFKASFQTCAACVPKDMETITVTLDCPLMNPPQQTQDIVMVKKCECRAVKILV